MGFRSKAAFQGDQTGKPSLDGLSGAAGGAVVDAEAPTGFGTGNPSQAAVGVSGRFQGPDGSMGCPHMFTSPFQACLRRSSAKTRTPR